VGDADPAALLDGIRPWLGGGPLERRAVAAGLCEPRLLARADVARSTLDVLDGITAGVAAASDRSEEARALRKGLGYCWSVAIVALPAEGKRRFERWAASDHADIRWIVRENLKKNRLRKLDPEWVESMKSAAPSTRTTRSP
jgi:hypothetical protein